ncbi:MAG TPA: hypothetical protein EYN91_12935 [Candidatus Melainabacteria bacterium]|jgi:hypothetical protein|nr:hypothetical protein [Candidatus Melainabacteria bacterium]HIN63886.1 hypothetical protein [Candidatus Obscuribacterales bacterium]
MGSQVSVFALKQQLEQLFPGKWFSAEKRHKALLTGVAEVDAKLVNGLLRRRITEWAGSISSGKTTLLRKAVANWCSSGLHVAYIDPSGRLSAEDWAFVGDGNFASTSAPSLVTSKGKFWVVRNLNVNPELNSMWAAEQLLLSQVFDVVIFDSENLRITSRMHARLKRALDRSKSALIVLRDNNRVSNSALSWGFHTQLNFSWDLPIDLQEGLFGCAAFIPAIKGNVLRDGLSQAIEVRGKSNVSNSLFTHSPIPDRRAAKV